MFKKRLKIVLGNIVGWSTFLFFLSGLVLLADAFHSVEVVLAYIAGATVVCGLLVMLYEFIKWLFIEPYKEWKAQNTLDN
jgi:hypothetical protein